jgi:hypothetical protein
MKTFGLGVMIALMLAVDPIGARSVSASGPDLVLSPGACDLGTLIPGQRSLRVLSLRNAGTETLEIRLARTSSRRRLTAHLSEWRLSSGNAGELRIEFSSDVWERGPFAEYVVLYSNDPDEPLVKVKVQGILRAPLGWNPRSLEFRIRRDEIDSLPTIRIIPQDGHPIGPLRVTSSVPYLSAEAEADAAGGYTVTLRLDPVVPLGNIQGWLVIETNHPLMPVLQVPVRAEVVGDLVIKPFHLDFGIVEEGQPATAKIALMNLGGLEVRVLKVEPHLPTVAEASLQKKGKHHEITVLLPSPPGLLNLEGHLDVHTDHPVEDVVRVPVVGWVWAKRPFDLIAAEGKEERLYDLVHAALFREEAVSAEDFLTKILGGVRDDRAVSLLLKALGEGNWHIRTRAVGVLGLLRNRRALEPVRKAVTDDVDEEVRRAAAAALVRIAGREALPELLLALQDDDDWVREDAAQLLGDLGDRRAIPALKNALRDEEEDVRQAARNALKKLTRKEVSRESHDK